jgi:adenine-specific DNA-methyltransferase
MRPAIALKTSKSNQLDLKVIAESESRMKELLDDGDPSKALQTGKLMAKAWAKSLAENGHARLAHSFMYVVMAGFWKQVHGFTLTQRELPKLNGIALSPLDESVIAVASAIGKAAGKLEIITASYELGNIYTSILPDSMRSGQGIFYTPPALTQRLLKITEYAGVDWKTARVIDPACGGGAFLMPVALKMVAALAEQTSAANIIRHIETHLKGYEIDAFGAWLTQVFVAAALRDLLRDTHSQLASLVTVCDSLNTTIPDGHLKFDLVIGNPPYGKVKLTDDIRNRYNDSLYGHANYYGLFTHLALDLVKEDGVIGFLTPTSFLSGEYFKNLRRLLRTRSNPVEIDFVAVRKGVFEDVLQETMLAVYQKKVVNKACIKVNQITTLPGAKLEITNAGNFPLAKDISAPWILPRNIDQGLTVKAMKRMPLTLKDYGYKVSTGPLVWNRHKEQLVKKTGKDCYPIIWSEAVTQDGRFILRAEKKNHEPFFKFKVGNESLVVHKPCIILQRTTAKEQDKRLIAAMLPAELIARRNGVVIENHLNMVLPVKENPPVGLAVLTALLNSVVVNDAFRTISGSVAVSAYELESLPLPRINQLTELEGLVAAGDDQQLIEQACYQLYHNQINK